MEWRSESESGSLGFLLLTNSIYRRRHERLFTLYIEIFEFVQMGKLLALSRAIMERSDFEKDELLGTAVDFKMNPYCMLRNTQCYHEERESLLAHKHQSISFQLRHCSG